MILSYARVSTDRQAEEDATSISEQQRKIKAIAQLRGAEHFDIQTYTDAGVSGSIPLKLRPSGARMLDDARKGDVIIAAKLDRLFRSATDALVTVERLAERGVKVILADMGTEPVTDNGIGKLFFQMLAAFADFERGRIVERMSDGRKAKARTHGHLGGQAPYGWQVTGVGRGATLIPLENEQVVMRKVIKLYHASALPSEITRILNKENVPSRMGTPWKVQQICRIIDRNRRAILLDKPGIVEEQAHG